MSRGQKFLLLPQRLQLTFEALDAVKAGVGLGVRLSGPNGVGKSAILFLTHLLCIARGLPAVYMPRAEELVNAARHVGGGDAFILEIFWRQNADIIIGNHALRGIFVAALQGAQDPFSPNVMAQLRSAVGKPGLRGIAIIMDEVQHITAEVRASGLPTAPTSVLESGRYFVTNWHDWTSGNAVFQRMSAASAHAERDTNLPDGESHRLRIVEPMQTEVRTALQAAPNSPAYVHDPATREYVVSIAGNVLRKLVTAAALLPPSSKPTKAQLMHLWQTMWESMRINCKRWLDSLPVAERSKTSTEVMTLLSGKILWGATTVLYDTGIVYRSSASPYVRPISAVAAAVLLRVTSAYGNATRLQLSTISDGRQRGFELERQVLANLDGFLSTHGVPSKLLDGMPSDALNMPCSYSLPFKLLDEVIALDVPVLYRPIDLTYPCDGVLMPASSDAGGAVHILECSTIDPTNSARVQKVGGYFKPDGVFTRLKAMNSGRDVLVALFYDADLPVRASLSAVVIDISSGTVPPPPPSSHASATAADGSAGALASDSHSAAEVHAPTAVASSARDASAASSLAPLRSPGKGKGVKKSGKKPEHARGVPEHARGVAGLGTVVRVVDAPSLLSPLGLLV